MITKLDIRRWNFQGILDRALAKRKTKKGAKHLHQETFESINHSGVSPAEYRYFHMKMVNGKIIQRAIKDKVKK